jgi:hypothetical protein
MHDVVHVTATAGRYNPGMRRRKLSLVLTAAAVLAAGVVSTTPTWPGTDVTQSSRQ